MKASERCIELIKQSEGYRRFPYDDAVGIRTIGYGHVIRPGESYPIKGLSESEATELLCKDLEMFEARILQLVTVDLTQNQFDALCDFCFNLGAGTLQKSTLLKKLNDGDYEGAADEMLRWDKAGGRQLAGLTKRREAEREMFLA